MCGWLLMYNTLIGLMLLLSLFSSMNRQWFIIGGFVIIAGMLVITLKYNYTYARDFLLSIKKFMSADVIDYIIYGGLIIFAIYIVGHNSLFFDSTWDAHVYQVPRIELFAQKESLFVKMNSSSINIISNEWNGELNAIFYTIMCGTNQGMFLANAENLLYSVLIVYWFCTKIGLNKNNVRMAVLWYCSMPVIILLAMTVKGDFVTIPLFLSTVIWLKEYIDKKSNYALFFLFVSGGLVAGTKITAIPFVGLCFISVMIYLLIENKGSILGIFKYIKSIWKVLLVGIPCAIVSCMRYVLNFIFWGDFFKRVDIENEKLILSLQNLKTSGKELIKTIIDCDNMFTQTGNVNALNQDMGIVGVIFAVLLIPTIIIMVVKHRSRSSRWLYVFFPLVGSAIFLIASTTWFVWSFRYYIPWVLVLFLFWILWMQEIFVNFTKPLKNLAYSAGVWLGIIGVLSTIVLTTRFGEVTHSTWAEAKEKPMIEREYGFHIYLLESYDGSPDIYDFFEQIKSGKKVLSCNAINSAVSYLFGEDNSNDITFCVPEELFVMLYNTEYDVVSISDDYLTPEIESYFGNGEWSVYMPAKDIIRAHVYIRIN